MRLPECMQTHLQRERKHNRPIFVSVSCQTSDADFVLKVLGLLSVNYKMWRMTRSLLLNCDGFGCLRRGTQGGGHYSHMYSVVFSDELISLFSRE